MEKQIYDAKYQYTACTMENVEDNPEEYIIPECLDACKILWSKNIYTFMCSNNEDGGKTWIAVCDLSEENREVLKSLEEGVQISSFRGTTKLQIDCEGIEAKKKFEAISNQFVMQDIPYGFRTIEDFLIECGCYKEVPNPQYVYKEFVRVDQDFSKWMEYDKYLDTIQSKETLKVYDESKLKKPIDEYVEEAGYSSLYIPTEGRIYSSKYHLEKHKRFLQQKIANPIDKII